MRTISRSTKPQTQYSKANLNIMRVVGLTLFCFGLPKTWKQQKHVAPLCLL
jgi:hypothetical protein